MKEGDYIEMKERIMLRIIGKSRIWKMSRLVIGLIPPVGSLVLLVHCLLLMAGIKVRLTEWIFDCSLSGFVAWIIVSLAYGFCWVHRAFITYGLMMAFCINFQRTVGFGSWLQPMHIAMITLGSFLFLVFIRKKAWQEFYIRNINHL